MLARCPSLIVLQTTKVAIEATAPELRNAAAAGFREAYIIGTRAPHGGEVRFALPLR